MAEWIELKNGELVNLDNVWNIYTEDFEHEHYRNRYYVRYSNHKSDEVYESYDSEEKREERFEEIRAMLIEE